VDSVPGAGGFVGYANSNLAVKTAGAAQGRVQCVRPIGGADHTHGLVARVLHRHICRTSEEQRDVDWLGKPNLGV